MKPKNIFYAQSGGVTAVINASACGVIETARANKGKIGKVYAGKNGILGALKEELIDTSKETSSAIQALRHTPSGAFGSCRYKLKSIEENRRDYERLIEVFKAHNIGYFLYNGGGDSQDTSHKVAEFSKQQDYPIQCIGIPKTVDNDLPFTDNSPGFGSVAKYVAVSTKETGLDIKSMCESSTKVFILEVMGRNAGWIAASGALANSEPEAAPHIILFPEIAFNQEKFLRKVKQCVRRYGYCVVVASEGAQTSDGKFLSARASEDAFGHTQLGGVAPVLAELVARHLGYKYHYAVADYLQRAARHIASATDVKQAYAVGKAAVDYALAGENAIMPIIQRKKSKRYGWKIDKVALADVANIEKKMPRSYITRDGFGVTQEGIDYLQPLIQGEDYPPYANGTPKFAQLKSVMVAKKLKGYKIR